RSEYMVRCRRFLSRAEIALVVQIYAVRESIVAARRPEALHQREQFIFAEETTLPIVAHVLWAIQFRRRNYFQRDRLLAGKTYRVGQLSARQAGRIGNNRQHFLPQGLIGRPGEISGIYAAGISDEQASHPLQVSLEEFPLRLGLPLRRQ